MSSAPPSAPSSFVGGRLCLDFANTVDWRSSSAPEELMPDYASLLDWSFRRGAISVATVETLRKRAEGEAMGAQAAYDLACDLRSQIWRLGEATHGGEQAALDALNDMLAAAPAQPRLIRCGGRYVHELPGLRLEEPLWPILWSATALIASQSIARLRCCEARGCGWLFVDESPNRSRLWCSSESCGNRERARRAYAKRRSP